MTVWFYFLFELINTSTLGAIDGNRHAGIYFQGRYLTYSTLRTLFTFAKLICHTIMPYIM